MEHMDSAYSAGGESSLKVKTEIAQIYSINVDYEVEIMATSTFDEKKTCSTRCCSADKSPQRAAVLKPDRLGSFIKYVIQTSSAFSFPLK